MNVEHFFPVIGSKKTGKSYESVLGIRMTSILKGDLLLNEDGHKAQDISYFHQLNPKVIQKTREGLLYALSAWDRDVTVELHLTALPDLVSRPQGEIETTLFIRIIGDSSERNNERVMACYMALTPLLASSFPYMEFEPVTNKAVLAKLLTPFKAWHAVSIERNTETIQIAAMLERQWVSGFGQSKEKPETVESHVIHRCPFIPTKDDGGRLLSLLMLQLDPCKIVFRIRPGQINQDVLSRMENIVKTCEATLSSSRDDQVTLNRQVTLIRDTVLQQTGLLVDACMDLGVFIFSPRSIDPSLGAVVGRTITEGRYGDGNDVYRGGFSVKPVDVKTALDSGFFPDDEPFTISETAGAFRLPVPPLDEQFGLPVKRFRSIMARLPHRRNLPDGSMELFHNVHQGMTQAVTMTEEDRMRHMFIIGQTGTGKSSLMQNMILQDIQAGKGLAVIDPHGDMVDDVISRMPPERKKDVILFDMLDRERPLGFNMLEWNTLDERDLIIDSLYQSIDNIFDMKTTGGPIFDQYFRGILRLLMMDTHHSYFTPTLLEFSLCFINESFRGWLKKFTNDPVTLDFCREIEKAGGDAKLENITPYITSKFARFISDRTLKLIVGQEKTSFDFSDIMDNGKLMFIKLGKGRFGSTVSSLLANQLVTRFKLAAMKRGNIPAEKRREFYLYVDECSNLPPENFTEILSEARKFRMGLVLATQYTGQLGNKIDQKNLLSSVIGNVGTIVSFRLGLEDANQIGQAFLPYFSAQDIGELPNHHGYARAQLNGQAVSPFSFKTKKIETRPNPECAKQIIDYSRKTYGKHYVDVETMIERRRTIWRTL